MGYSAFVVHYRCGTGMEYPIPQDDLARAIQEIREHSNALENNGVTYRFLPIEGVGHGVGIGEGLPCEGWFEEAVSFWGDICQ